MRLCFQRIPQKDHKVNLAFHDLGAYLLIASERTAAESLYRKPRPVCYQTGRCTGSAEEMSFQDLFISVAPVYQLFLLAIMGDQSDMLCLADFHCHIIII